MGLVRPLAATPPRPTPHRPHGVVRSVAFAPDGHTLASGSYDQSVVLWDLSDRSRPRRLGQPLTGHNQGVTAVTFAPDGRSLVSAGRDGTVALWDLTGLTALRSHAVENACLLTGRGLDRDEWARYVSGLPYQRTCPD